MRSTNLRRTAVWRQCCAVILMVLWASVTGFAQQIPNPFDLLPEERANAASELPETMPAAAANEFPVAEEAQIVEAPIVEAPIAQAPIVAEVFDKVLGQPYRKAMLIDLKGPIFGKFRWYLNHRLDLAQEVECDLVILRLTSPGGDLESSLQLARRLRDVDWATTIVYVPEEAISGGAIIALGADRIYMQTGALIGDAGPIRMGLGGQFEHAEEKIVSYTAEAVGEIAKAKGRPGAIAEAMVDRKLKVFEAVELATGGRVFQTQTDIDNPLNQGLYEIRGPVPETGENRFLTLAADRAKALSLCEGVFDSEASLLAKLTIGSLARTEMNWVDHTVYILNRPWLTAILLIAGLIGLYLELVAPGLSVAGLSSLGCFGIFFWSHALGGTAGWLEVLLFVLGLICVACELFVLPGFGVFGISGIVLVVVSLVMASQDFVLPENATQWGQLRGNVLIVLSAVLGVMLLFVGQILLFDSIPGLNRFRLEAPGEAEPWVAPNMVALTQQSVSVTVTIQVGMLGVAESDLRPSGKVVIDERLFDVVTEGDYVDAGTAIEVIKVEGNRVTVRRRSMS